MLSIFFTAKVQIVDYPELVREAFGTSQDLTCSATGDPPPMITWMKDGMMVRTFIIQDNYWTPCGEFNGKILTRK